MYVQVPRVRLHSQIPRSARLSSVQGWFWVTRVATEKSDFRHSAFWSFCAVADHVGSGLQASHHARDSEGGSPHQSQQNHAYGLVSDSESSRDNVIAAFQVKALTNFQSTVTTEFTVKIKSDRGRDGGFTSSPLFFQPFIFLARQPRDIPIGL